MRRLDPGLVTALAASLALAATLFFVPDAPWRAPLAILAGVWAPGYAIVALAYRRGRLTALERHALAAGIGLVVLPLLGLAASALVGFRPTSLAGAALVVTLGVGAAAAMRAPIAPEPIARSPAPSRRATAAIAIGALLVATAVLLPTLVARPSVPHSLALTDAAGMPLDLRHASGATIAIRIEATAGTEAISDTLRVTWGDATILERQLTLEAGTSELIDLAPTLDARERVLNATWAGREVHATFAVEARR